MFVCVHTTVYTSTCMSSALVLTYVRLRSLILSNMSAGMFTKASVFLLVQDYECQIRTLQEQVERQSTIMTESIMSSAAGMSSQFGDYCSSNEDFLGQSLIILPFRSLTYLLLSALVTLRCYTNLLHFNR